MNTQLEILRNRVKQIIHPGDLVIPVNGTINGLAFFPAGDGAIHSDGKISNRKYMVLGQDQDNERGYKITLGKGKEDYSATWLNIKDLFAESSISLEDCFFTNALLGVRKDSISNVGKSQSFQDREFVKDCMDFLFFQITIQQPKAIICLGMIPVRLLSHHSKDLRERILLLDTFEEIDKDGHGVNHNIKFDSINDYTCDVVILTHPSYRKLNAKNRSYGSTSGLEAEVQMLKSVANKN